MKKKFFLSIVIMACIVGIFLIFNNKVVDKKNTSQTLTTLSQNQDPFLPGDSKTNARISGSSNYVSSEVVSPDPESMLLTYNGEPIQIEYQFTCEKSCTMGLMIFVNGILQPYRVVSEIDTTTMHTVEMGDRDTKRFKFEFTPVCGEKNDRLVVIFANIYNAKVMELSGDINTFGNNQKISQPLPWTLVLNEDSEKKNFKISTEYKNQPISTKEMSEFIRVDNDGNRRNLLDNVCNVEIKKENILLSGRVSFSTQNTNSLNVYLFGNMTGKYKLSLYGDFKPLLINGYDYIEVDIRKNEYSIIPFSYSSEDVAKYKNMFAILAPMDFKNELEKSPSIYISAQ